MIEAKDMLTYIYPDRKTTNINLKKNDTPIIHTNISTYAQALIQFH